MAEPAAETRPSHASPAAWQRWRDSAVALHVRLTQPRGDGLPNALVVAWFPVLLLLVVGVLVALSLTGSSSGVYWPIFHDRADPNLVWGRPRPIRSDEWLVQTSWLVSQDAQGYPDTNAVFPGGMDATVWNDLPSWHWSSIFRPHTWGSLLFGIDHGVAVRWWAPAALMTTAVYFFVVTLLPRRPLLGATLAVTVLFQPLVQWWWMPVVPNPVAFGFAAMAAVVWGVRSHSRLLQWVPALASGFLAVNMAMSLYVPFIIPAVLVLGAFTLGFVLYERRSLGAPLGRVLRGLVPLAVSGVAAGGVAGLWLLSRRDTIHAISSTVYPGRRTTPPGSGTEVDFLSLISAPFQRSLQFEGIDFRLSNASETSSSLLVSVFLVAPLLWVLGVQMARRSSFDWLVATVVAVQLVVIAFVYIPGWGALAHLVGLDRAVPQRLGLAFVMLIVVSVVVLIERLERLEVRATWPWAVAPAVLAVLATAWAWRRLSELGSNAVPSTATLLVTALLAMGLVGVARRRAMAGGVLILAASLVVGAGVNPLYRSVFDLREQTEAGREVTRIAERDPDGRWVGVGSYVAMATVMETGVPGYSGVQTYPSTEMWSQIDPDGTYEDAWNRLAHVHWFAGVGDPMPRQPPEGYRDQIHLTFDSCAAFAQEHVTYVVADTVPIDQPCVQEIRTVRQGPAKHWIYEVVPPR